MFDFILFANEILILGFRSENSSCNCISLHDESPVNYLKRKTRISHQFIFPLFGVKTVRTFWIVFSLWSRPRRRRIRFRRRSCRGQCETSLSLPSLHPSCYCKSEITNQNVFYRYFVQQIYLKIRHRCTKKVNMEKLCLVLKRSEEMELFLFLLSQCV